METIDKKTPELARYGESTDDSDDSSDDSNADSSSAKTTDKGDERSSRREWFGDNDDKDKDEKKPASLYDLFEQHADPEPPLENLANDEQILVADEATELNLDAANQELVGTEPGSPEEAAAIAGATFNEAVRERIDSGELPSEETLDAAMTDTADIMGLDAAELPEEDPVDLEGLEASAPAPEDTEDMPAEALPEGVDPMTDEGDGAEAVPEAEDREIPGSDDPDVEVVADPGEPDPADANDDPAAAAPPPSGATGSPGSPGGPGTPGGPPIPPTPPFGPGPGAAGPTGFGGARGGHGPAFGPGVPFPVPAAPWMAPGIATALAAGNALRHNRRHRHWPYVLAGGVVGYLIGRRRGRIKTEKKLKPIQQRLETQVGDLQFQLALREAKIRKLAYEKAISHPHIHAALPKRLKELQELQKANLKKADFERSATSELTKEAAQQTKRGEKIMAAGLAEKVIKMTERDRYSEASKPAPTPRMGTRPAGHRAELTPAKDMALAELLTIAEQIPVEDRSLRALYETGRISQRGLRRVIEAYLRGERFDRILFTELNVGDGVEVAVAGAAGEVLPTPAMSQTTGDTAEPAALFPDLEVPSALDAADPLLGAARTDYYEQLTGLADSDNDNHRFPWAMIAVAGVTIGIVVIVLLYLM